MKASKKLAAAFALLFLIAVGLAYAQTTTKPAPKKPAVTKKTQQGKNPCPMCQMCPKHQRMMQMQSQGPGMPMRGMMGGMPGMMGMMQPPTMVIDGGSIYILRGNELLKLSRATLELEKNTMLPPPSGPPPGNQMAPPPPAPPTR